MGLFKWFNSRVKKMKWYDVSVLKLCVFFFTLFLITAWRGFRNLVLGYEWYLYLAVAVILMLPLLKKVFFD